MKHILFVSLMISLGAVLPAQQVPAADVEEVRPYTPGELQACLKETEATLIKWKKDITPLIKATAARNDLLISKLEAARQEAVQQEKQIAAYLKTRLQQAEVAAFLKAGNDLQKARKYQEAADAFKSVAEKAPDSPQGRAAIRRILECLMNKPGDLQKKMDEFLAWSEQLNTAGQGTARLAIAEKYLRFSRYEEAGREIQAIIDGKYSAETIAQARYLQAAIKISEFEFDEALALLDEIKDQPEARDFEDRITYCRAWCLIVTERKEEGLKLLRDFETKYPSSEYIKKLGRLLESAQMK